MSDLISRAALLQSMNEQAPKPTTDDLYMVNMCIINAAAVDAVPVVHSCWKQTDAYPHWLYCMNCYKRIVPNVKWVEEYNIPTNFCPNCGAKMDGERRDENATD